MPEQPITPPRVHLVSCLYVITGLVVVYLICLRLYLPPSITYHSPPDVTLSVVPFVHTDGFFAFLICVGCLAVSYWERFLVLKLITGFIGTTIPLLALPVLFFSGSEQITGDLDYMTRQEHAMIARVTTDLSYYPLKYSLFLVYAVTLLRLSDYRPKTFRLTLLDVMLITLAVAVILGTRGIAMKVYAVG